MAKKINTIIILCFSFLQVLGQGNETLITIGNVEISLGEFEHIYNKNNSNLYSESDKKTPQEYLGLFINFKLKAIEAQNLKMDTSSAFIKELSGYRKELAAPYLTDIQFEQGLVEEMHRRMAQEVDASHILLRLGNDATPEKERQVLQKALEIRQEIVDGKDFNEAALEYSEDPSAKKNMGKLGYFTAFTMVAPFEDAAYNTQVGEVSEPFRSAFGYHILKVNDKRQNRGEIKVAHIMKMFPKTGLTDAGKRQLKAEIDSVYNLLEDGADFSVLAQKFSDDKRSGTQGGEMPWFSAGKMIPAFAKPAFALENIGDYTRPVETAYGFHIIKKLDEKPVGTFEELKPEIERRIKKNPLRATSVKKAFVEKLKKEYNYNENMENLAPVRDMEAGTEVEDPSQILFAIDGENFDFNSLKKFIEDKGIQNGTYGNYFEQWAEYEITKLEDSKLEGKYPEFRYLMKEYHDGMLLFNISEERIWNYAVEDSAGLEIFYNKNKNKYSWEERFKGYIVECDCPKTREEAEKYFAEGMTPEEISDIINVDGEKITITEGAWEKGRSPIVDYYVWDGAEFEGAGTGKIFIRGDKTPPRAKTLDEARGLYISDYQDYLEEKWIKELRGKYKIKVDKKLLKTVPSV